MLKLEFVNAIVKDDGYGMYVNGKALADIISTALGVKVGDTRAGYGSKIPSFNSTCCNVAVIIDPQPVTSHIEDDDYDYGNVESMEEFRREQFKKNAETDPEE